MGMSAFLCTQSISQLWQPCSPASHLSGNILHQRCATHTHTHTHTQSSNILSHTEVQCQPEVCHPMTKELHIPCTKLTKNISLAIWSCVCTIHHAKQKSVKQIASSCESLPCENWPRILSEDKKYHKIIYFLCLVTTHSTSYVYMIWAKRLVIISLLVSVTSLSRTCPWIHVHFLTFGTSPKHQCAPPTPPITELLPQNVYHAWSIPWFIFEYLYPVYWSVYTAYYILLLVFFERWDEQGY